MTKTSTRKITPDLMAQRWASANPEYAGIVIVKSSSPAGRGGYRITTKRTPYIALKGRAARAVVRRLYTTDHTPTHQRNGTCGLCGALFLEPAVATCRDAGGGAVDCCAPCMFAHDLARDDGRMVTRRLDRYDRFGNSTVGARPAWPMTDVDIRPAQSNLFVQLAQTATVLG